MPSTVAIAAGTEAGSPTDASSTIHTPSGNSPASSAPASSASRVLPTPPTPLSVTSRFDRTSSATSSTTASRPTSELSCCGRLPANVSTPRSTGNSAGSPSATTWYTAIRPRRPRSRCSPSGRSVTPVAQQHLGRVGHEHLTAVRERHQPRRAVHLGAEVVPVALDRRAGVQPHPHREVHGRCRRAAAPATRSPRPPRRRQSRTRPRSRRHRCRTRSRRAVRSCRARSRRARAARRPCRSGASSHRRVESSMSVNRNVTVPTGSPRGIPER